MKILLGQKDSLEFQLATLVPYDTGKHCFDSGKYCFKSKSLMDAVAMSDPKLKRLLDEGSRPAINVKPCADGAEVLMEYTLCSNDSTRLSRMAGCGITRDHDLSLRLTLKHFASREFAGQLTRGEQPEIITLHFLASRPRVTPLVLNENFLREVEQDPQLFNGEPRPVREFIYGKRSQFSFVTIFGKQRPAYVHREFIESLDVPFLPISPARCKLWLEGNLLWAFGDPDAPYKIPKSMIPVLQDFINSEGAFLPMTKVLDRRYGRDSAKETRKWKKMFRFRNGNLIREKFFEKKAERGVRIHPAWMGATDLEVLTARHQYYSREENLERLYNPEFLHESFMQDVIELRSRPD